MEPTKRFKLGTVVTFDVYVANTSTASHLSGAILDTSCDVRLKRKRVCGKIVADTGWDVRVRMLPDQGNDIPEEYVIRGDRKDLVAVHPLEALAMSAQ
jgi:hypothetical protein